MARKCHVGGMLEVHKQLLDCSVYCVILLKPNFCSNREEGGQQAATERQTRNQATINTWESNEGIIHWVWHNLTNGQATWTMSHACSCSSYLNPLSMSRLQRLAAPETGVSFGPAPRDVVLLLRLCFTQFRTQPPAYTLHVISL